MSNEAEDGPDSMLAAVVAALRKIDAALGVDGEHCSTPEDELAAIDMLRVGVPLALRPTLHVGETEDGEFWCLWCYPESASEEAIEHIPALYARQAQDEAEEKRASGGDPHWGPDVDAMWAEFIRSASDRGAR